MSIQTLARESSSKDKILNISNKKATAAKKVQSKSKPLTTVIKNSKSKEPILEHLQVLVESHRRCSAQQRKTVFW